MAEIEGLVRALREGDGAAKAAAARALRDLAGRAVSWLRPTPLITIAEAGAIRRSGRDRAAVRFEALVQLARRRVTVGYQFIVHDAGVPAKRKAALVVAALLRDYVPEFKSAPRDIKTVIASYL
ncbi:hypothetical protein JL720_17368 [Aureococcus anophagefferens]|nr:hypothetical protein JL720_17368 [Aureococcus anophagefferens]